MQQTGKVRVWQEALVIPTYGVGKPDRNPMFLEKRVYQGSSGRVYPYPVIDKILDEKQDQTYQAVWLENDYLKVMILPELGGRIQRAYDKTNGYDFVYYNEVIKPALVGLTGPWISGGIEFNWPQHHRPTTYAPTDFVLKNNPDGSATVQVSEVDQMYGTKGMASFTLYPDKAYIEIKGQLYNRTNTPQTFLWWANPAVPVNDYTQSIFPPDVTAVMDHGKRDVSRFPIATGVYYKHDYGAGVDISRYKNIPVPTSYMAYHSDYNFVGGYDYQVEAGILHIADHHVSPGKKQWTWGCGDFGKAWDRNLTDENGPYIELMTGMFTDNQPDFTWLKPFEEKTFTQYFMPYKKAGSVKNASTEIVLNLEVADGVSHVVVYATGPRAGVRTVLTGGGKTWLDRTDDLSPTQVLCTTAETGDLAAHELTLSVYDADGRLLLDYTAAAPHVDKVPDPARPAKGPAEIATCEELYLTAQHLEQYRHATYDPDPYYLEGLKRDPGDIRLNTGYGLLLLRRGLFAQAEKHFRAAIARLTWKNPNPYDSEAYYDLGLALFYQGRDDEAFDAFYKATWTAAQQEMSFYYLAAISARRGEWREALAHVERSLVRNAHNLKARSLRAILLDKQGRRVEALDQLRSDLELDPFCYVSRYLLGQWEGTGHEELLHLMGNRASSFIECAIDLAEAGQWDTAVAMLRLCTAGSPMLKYYEGAYLARLGDEDASRKAFAEAKGRSPLYCFPNKLEDLCVLQQAMEADPTDPRAPYYLGCLYYDKKQYETSRQLWEKSAELDPAFPTVWRNLSLTWFNNSKDPVRAREGMEKAFALDTTDARILLELDQLYKKTGVTPAERLANLDKYPETWVKRDDLCVEYVTLLNLLGSYEEAYTIIMGRHFHPWEGGEGKVTKQYATALTQMGLAKLNAGDAAGARDLLLKALVFPENLGEGKLEGAKDNDIYYALGCAERMLGNEEQAVAYFERASVGTEEPAGMMYYNDQPADMILYQGLAHRALGREEAALARFHKLVDYGEKHLFDTVKIDYFAVSLPELQLFEEDLTRRNQGHCHYLIGLGSYGLGDTARAAASFAETLRIDCAHQGAILHSHLCN